MVRRGSERVSDGPRESTMVQENPRWSKRFPKIREGPKERPRESKAVGKVPRESPKPDGKERVGDGHNRANWLSATWERWNCGGNWFLSFNFQKIRWIRRRWFRNWSAGLGKFSEPVCVLTLFTLLNADEGFVSVHHFLWPPVPFSNSGYREFHKCIN